MTYARFSRRAMMFCTLAATAMRARAARPSAVGHFLLQPAAPFVVPPIRVPDFSAAPRFTITDFGATPGNTQKTSAAIAQAIAAAHAAGAGVVVVPPGVWQSGAIHLKSGVNLHVERGATLEFSPDPAEYLPPVSSSWEGIECYNYSPLIYAFGCRDVALSGGGTLLARLDVWATWFARPKPHMDALIALYQMARKGVPVKNRVMTNGAAHLRPQFIQFNRCRNVLIEDLHIENSPFWTVHPFLCRDVVIRNLHIHAHGHNNDGVDPEMSQNVLIEGCSFDQGDDAVSVKSGRDMDAWRIGVPAKNIILRNCTVLNGHQLMAIGSELSGGIENVFVTDCKVIQPEAPHTPGERTVMSLGSLLYVKTNERRGGFVRNIWLENVSAEIIGGGILAVETDVLYQWKTLLPTYVRRLTPINGLHVKNVKVGQADYICRIKAEKQAPVRDVSLENIQVRVLKHAPYTFENVVGVTRKNIILPIETGISHS